MKVLGIGRLGKDAELRRTTSGMAVANILLAWNYGKKGTDGMKPSQWLECSLFGAIAEKLTPYLKKGTQVFIDGRDLHVETFEKKDGSLGSKLCATIDSVEIIQERKKEEVPF